MLRILARRGFALHPEYPCRAGVLTLDVYKAVTGTVTKEVVQGAAGIEMQMEAAYIFDSVADGELGSSTESATGKELALAIALLYCGASATF